MESPLKNRAALAKHFNKLGFKIGAEIGVYEGYYSEVLCTHIPHLKLFCIDIWERVKGSTGRNWHYDIVKQRLAPYDCTLIKKFSMDAVKDFADESLDFVYIDAHHNYEYVRDDIREWSKKVRPGGIVSGHDYYVGKSGNTGVIRAVDEYVKEHGCNLQLTQWNNRGTHRDNFQPSWWFVKD